MEWEGFLAFEDTTRSVRARRRKGFKHVSLELDDLAELLEGGLGRGSEDFGVFEMSEVIGGLEELKLFHVEGPLLVMVPREVGRAQLQHASVSL